MRGRYKTGLLALTLVGALAACDGRTTTSPPPPTVERENAGSFERTMRNGPVQIHALVDYDQTWTSPERQEQLQSAVDAGLTESLDVIRYQLERRHGLAAPQYSLHVRVVAEGDLPGVPLSVREPLGAYAGAGGEDFVWCGEHNGPSSIESCLAHQFNHAIAAALPNGEVARAMHLLPGDGSLVAQVYTIFAGETSIDAYLTSRGVEDPQCGSD